MLAGAVALLGAAAATPAPAQTSGGAARPSPSAGPVAEPAPPSDPAPAPPPPARLDRPARPPPPPRLPTVAAPLPGLESLPGGGWRLRFGAGTSALPPAAAGTLGDLSRRLLSQEPPVAGPGGGGRFTVVAQASGPADDLSVARRLSLARGIAVKDALVAGGLPATRIDIRPMGRTEDTVDAVDIIPPETRAPQPPQGGAPGGGGR
jgi:hypothetical protein